MEVIVQPWLASKSDTDRGARFRGRGHGPWGGGSERTARPDTFTSPIRVAGKSGRQWAPTVPDFHVALGPLTVTYRLSFTPTSLSSAQLRSSLPLRSSLLTVLLSLCITVRLVSFPRNSALESKRNPGAELDWVPTQTTTTVYC